MNAQDIQKQYYQNIAADYEKIHFQEDDEHLTACKLICALCYELEITSILDTGCGTGRNAAYFKTCFPQVKVMGNDVSAELLQVATDKHRIPSKDLVCCSSYKLPFADNSFDIVTEFGILHHVDEPERVVAEMLRVARQAIFISDSNRFGQGGLLSRLVKLMLYKGGLWSQIRWLVNGGKKWNYSEGDGVYYSYSVFDNLKLVEDACSKVFAIPTRKATGAAVSPLLFAPQVLLCGFKK
jgi:ubiquinone/menaquinone biosynthesis C-methylase UbiE